MNTAAERRALVAMARAIPGCTGVEDHLIARVELLANVPPSARLV